MCGIAGIFHYREPRRVDASLLDRMTDLIAHRGPDGRDVWIDGAVGFGHRRLSIVDLSEAGKQPMKTSDGGVVITYNGETYNHADFRPELEASGVRFRGHSDTETIIYLYRQRGAAAFNELAGIFAFGLWDAREQALYLVRDPLGVKQVYYHDDGRSIAFASEVKALLLMPGVAREPDLEAIGEYLHFHTAVGERTWFRGIRLVPPGHYARVDAHGVVVRRYASEDDYSPLGMTQDETIAALQSSIGATVKSQLMSDVPVGCFVSGGIDSTVVAKYSRDFTRGKLNGFGCYFNDAGAVNEEPYAQEVSRALDLDLHVTHPTVNDFTDLFERALWHQDEPKIGPAMISMWKVAEIAANDVTVCLGGQAADEIFAGYARYATAAPLRILAAEGRKRLLRRREGPAATVQKQLAKGNNAARLLRLMNPLHGWERRYFDTVAQIPRSLLASIFGEQSVIADRGRYFDAFRALNATCASKDPVDRAMYWDRKVYLPGLFVQDDRMSMAHSLETRVPLADPRMVRLALRIPNEWKMNGLASKWILKQALRGVIPDWVINRQKAGFDTPARLWFTGPAREMTHDLLAGSRTRERGLFDTTVTAKLLDDVDPLREVLIWKLINIEQWFRIFIDTPPEQWRYASPAAKCVTV